MLRTMFAAFVVALSFGLGSSFGQQTTPAGRAAVSPNQALINGYSATCHNEKLQTAQLLLDKSNLDAVSESPAVWEKVAKKLRAGAMPPQGMPKPEKAALETFVKYLESELDRTASSH